MMIRKMAGMVLLAGTMLAGTAQAEQVGGLYLGITGGVDRIDVAGVDDADMYGVVGGLRFGSGLSVEAAFGKSDTDTGGGCTVDIDTLGLYGAFRSSGNVYFKGRVGLLHEKLSDDCGSSLKDTGLSLGAGAGVRFGGVAVEAEYTIIEQDIDRLSLTFLYNF
ncbi:MAG: outer membrane beta-barrel protein [Moraxellaceae bacterium]|nr:outer membrane beta-barrel protein [Moraxellaceae bacterium]